MGRRSWIARSTVPSLHTLTRLDRPKRSRSITGYPLSAANAWSHFFFSNKIAPAITNSYGQSSRAFDRPPARPPRSAEFLAWPLYNDIPGTAMKQRLLVVEDDDDLRDLLGSYLSDEFAVTLAQDGYEAIQLATRQAEPIDAVVA